MTDHDRDTPVWDDTTQDQGIGAFEVAISSNSQGKKCKMDTLGKKQGRVISKKNTHEVVKTLYIAQISANPGYFNFETQTCPFPVGGGGDRNMTVRKRNH